MPWDIGEVPESFRLRIINSDPQLSQQQQTIFSELEASCRDAEEFMKQFGEVDSMRATVERSRSFIRGDITLAEFEEGNRLANEALIQKLKRR